MPSIYDGIFLNFILNWLGFESFLYFNDYENNCYN